MKAETLQYNPVQKIIEGEVTDVYTNDSDLANTQPIYVTAKIVINPPNSNSSDYFIPIIINKLNLITESLAKLSLDMKNLKHSHISTDLSLIHSKLDVVVEAFGDIPEWIPAYLLQESTGLTADAIRQQLKNPARFEPGKDFRKNGRIWEVHKNAIPKVRRLK